MNKLYLCLMLGIFVFSLTQISAVELNGGECDSFEFQNSNPVNFELVSNTTSLVDFKWNQSGNIITYCFSIAQSEGNFTLKWFNEEFVEEKEAKNKGGSGGFFGFSGENDNQTNNETEKDVKETPDKEQPKKDDEQEKPNENEKSKIINWFVNNWIAILFGAVGLVITWNVISHILSRSKRENSSSESNDELNDGDNNEQE